MSRLGSTPVKSDKSVIYWQAMIPGVNQRQAVSGSSQKIALGGTNTSLIRIFATQDCWVKIGEYSSIVAAVNDGTSMFLGGGQFEYLGISDSIVQPGVAVIQDSVAGTIHVVEAV